MSRVSVTGTKPVLDTVIETVHELDVLHLSDYDGAWEGFDPGDPVIGADEAAERLVTVRSLLSILDVEDRDGVTDLGDDDAMADRLETVREDANRLDDRREEHADERATLDERIDAMESLETLGIDLDLLAGYDALETRVGEADESVVRAALDDASDVERYETFAEGETVAVFAVPVDGERDVLDDALSGVDVRVIEVPDAEGSPDAHTASLRDRRADVDSDIESVDADLRALREEHAAFLLAAEEHLAIEVQRREAPLSFATTRNAFVAEGWIPSARYDDLDSALDSAVGDHVAVEELERATYDDEGRVTERSDVEADESEAVAADGGERVRADGGTETAMAGRDPPVVQENPGPVKPFELLVRTVSRPRYSEIDPSIILFLTLPLMFGFMIGDAGYGLLYLGLGYVLYSRFDSAGIRSLGAVALWAGGFTLLFGILYGEIFGFEFITTYVWEGALGLEHQPLHKGLMPTYIAYAEAWLLISVLFGILHMAIGYVFDFVDNLRHGVRTAMLESGSWLVLMVGVWVWILSHAAEGAKPELLFRVFDGQPFALGFAGFSPTVGWTALAIGLVVGLGLATANEVSHFGGVGLLVGPLEGLRAALVNPLSYTRLAAEVLAEVGLAFAVNLLVFGAYQENGEFHFLLGHGPDYVTSLGGEASLMFPGLVNAGVVGVVFGLVVLVAGHLLVLGIGVMSAGLQAVRLEYVEFFNQFYEGGGDEYRPFGYHRRHTTEE